jgi:catechol 2,3-dioxygenase-like lactoylglutathione lyase family enzyme
VIHQQTHDAAQTSFAGWFLRRPPPGLSDVAKCFCSCDAGIIRELSGNDNKIPIRAVRSPAKLFAMIIGTHVLFYSAAPDEDRAFFRDVLGFKSVDAGGGWLIFGLPPAEAAFHPTEGKEHGNSGSSLFSAEVYLMCDDLKAEMKRLQAKNVTCSPMDKQRWGIRTTLRLPSGGQLGLHQPTHPTAIALK